MLLEVVRIHPKSVRRGHSTASHSNMYTSAAFLAARAKMIDQEITRILGEENTMTPNEYKQIQTVLQGELERVKQINQDDSYNPYYVAGRYQGVQNVCYSLAKLFSATFITFDRDSFLLGCGLDHITVQE